MKENNGQRTRKDILQKKKKNKEQNSTFQQTYFENTELQNSVN